MLFSFCLLSCGRNDFRMLSAAGQTSVSNSKNYIYSQTISKTTPKTRPNPPPVSPIQVQTPSLFNPLSFTSQNPRFISPIQPNPLTFLRFFCTIMSFVVLFFTLSWLFSGLLLPKSLYLEGSEPYFFILTPKSFFIAIPQFPPLHIPVLQVFRILFQQFGFPTNKSLGRYPHLWYPWRPNPLD